MKNFYCQTTKNLPNLEDLEPYLKKSDNARSQLLSDIKNNQIAPINIAFQINDLDDILSLANEINQKFSKIFVLAVGGSSLGGKTLTAINNAFHKITFIESIDSSSIINDLESVKFNESLFLVISKSGETIETICQTLIIIEKFKQQNIPNFNQNFCFITQSYHNTIAKIALEIGAKIYLHPENIGGRFSYLTIVGLLPAAICGLNIFDIRSGAKQAIENFIIESSPDKNQITKIVASQLYLFDRGFGANVIMPYVNNLKNFTDWYRQLWAESLGKNNFGSTPINSMGTVDQHSQLQLYLQGPRDKFFTFITDENPRNNFDIFDIENCPTLFGGKNLNQILKIEQDSTIEVFNLHKIPMRILAMEKINEKALSYLMMQMFLETIMIAKVKKIDPFDQPAVELRKNLAKQYLSI